MQAAGQQPAFNLHQLPINGPHHPIAAIHIQAGGIVFGQGYVFIEVAEAGGFHDRVNDLHAAATFPQLLIGTHQLTQLLEALIQTSIFRRRG